MTGSNNKLQFKPLSSDVRRGGFCCGEHELDRWFRKDAIKHHVSFRSRVTVACLTDNESIVGFHSLSMAFEDAKLLDNNQQRDARSSEGKFVSLRADYIGVEKNFQRQGYGLEILADAVQVFYKTIILTGVPAMTLVCIHKEKVPFYEKMGFVCYGPRSDMPRMFLPARSVIEAYATESAALENSVV